MKILIDADYIVYKSCAAAESEVDFGDDVILVTSNFNDAYNAAKREIAKIEKKLGDFSTTSYREEQRLSPRDGWSPHNSI